jgi:hypothetical protein
MVRYKSLPKPCNLDQLRDIHAAVPADPEATDDCCARLCAVGEVHDRDAAREWLPFLTALGLVSRGDAGYQRLAWRERAQLAESFRENVLGASELLTVIESDGPISIERLFVNPRIREATATKTAGRDEDVDQNRAVKFRVKRLLGWSEVFGLITRNSAGEYVASG